MTPANPLVPRHRRGDAMAGYYSYVTDSDAAKLEGIVEAARKMRFACECIHNETNPIQDGCCSCAVCVSARAFDAARAEVGGKL